jgi:hypothetical protein
MLSSTLERRSRASNLDDDAALGFCGLGFAFRQSRRKVSFA